VLWKETLFLLLFPSCTLYYCKPHISRISIIANGHLLFSNLLRITRKPSSSIRKTTSSLEMLKTLQNLVRPLPYTHTQTRTRTAPSGYQDIRLTFHSLRTAQLLSSLVVGAIMSFFIYHLTHGSWPMPWTFIVVCFVSSS